MTKLDEAVAAFDAAMAEHRVPVRAVFAAALVLNLPVAEALNVLLAAGKVDFVGYARPWDKVNGEGCVLARV